MLPNNVPGSDRTSPGTPSPSRHELATMEELVGVTDRVKIPTKAEFQVRLRFTVPADQENGSVCAGIGGQFPPEWLVNLERNEWSVSSGIGGQFAPEYAEVGGRLPRPTGT